MFVQNGLGQAKFGYTDWNAAREEHIDVHGKTEGSYQYALPNGQNYEVKYWADKDGFHQTDNRPEVVLVPVTDTPVINESIAIRKWKLRHKTKSISKYRQ